VADDAAEDGDPGRGAWPPARWPAQPACTAKAGGSRECGKPSLFIVARTDADESHGSGGGTEEACGEHLAAAVLAMVDGDDDVDAVVTVRLRDPQARREDGL
jgi:hypothetical protein